VPWKEWNKAEEGMRFVARLLDGEKMAVLCREFDISRKTCAGQQSKADIDYIFKCEFDR
jgi:hypothetical protein